MRPALLIAVLIALLPALTGCKDTRREDAVIRQMQTIAEKAKIYYSAEHRNKEGRITTGFPKSSGKSCDSGDASEGVWAEMGVSKLDPPDVSYCYETDLDGKRFAVSTEDQNTKYCLKGQKDSNGSPSIGVVVGSMSLP